MTYLKRFWDESRGDKFDEWGTSTWYFEASPDDYPVRQIEVYASGKILKYNENNPYDKYGGLSDQPLEVEEYEPLTKDEFEAIWQN
ncbi:MAG: hypothetical protein ABIN95_07035 [Mucilaginibacter sp.]